MALNVKRIKTLIASGTPGRYSDRRGLYLNINEGNGRSWLLRYQRAGREHWMGLGSFYEFDLEAARERARLAKVKLRDGIDPLQAKRAAHAQQVLEDAQHLTFKQAAQQYFDSHQHEWSNAEHRRQFLSTLETYAFPAIGALSVRDVDTPSVLKVLQPIWKTKRVTASRVRSRIESVLGWAIGSGYRTGDNPARWAGHLKEVLPKKKDKVIHHPAMPYDDVPAFIAELKTQHSVDALAMEFLILAAARKDEVVKARWPEFELRAVPVETKDDDGTPRTVAGPVWIVPPGRIKGRRQHKVPLSDRVVAILNGLKREADGFIFQGTKPGRPLDKNALWNLLKAMGHDVTLHGFRSAFRDWCEDRTNFSRETKEAALAHKTGDDTELSYKRTDVLEKRRKLMAMWAAFCLTPRQKLGATVTPIGRKRGG
jgi:integrase